MNKKTISLFFIDRSFLSRFNLLEPEEICSELRGKCKKFFDIMGSGSDGHNWMYKPTYHHLVNKLTN